MRRRIFVIGVMRKVVNLLFARPLFAFLFQTWQPLSNSLMYFTLFLTSDLSSSFFIFTNFSYFFVFAYFLISDFCFLSRSFATDTFTFTHLHTHTHTHTHTHIQVEQRESAVVDGERQANNTSTFLFNLKSVRARSIVKTLSQFHQQFLSKTKMCRIWYQRSIVDLDCC